MTEEEKQHWQHLRGPPLPPRPERKGELVRVAHTMALLSAIDLAWPYRPTVLADNSKADSSV